MGFEVNDFAVEPGRYPAKVVSVEERDGTNGTFRGWVFEITEGKAKEMQIYGNSSMFFGQQSKSRQWVETALNRRLDQGEKLDYADLKNKPVVIEVDMQQKDRGIFPTIQAVLSADTPVDRGVAVGKPAPPSRLDAATEDDLDSIPF